MRVLRSVAAVAALGLVTGFGATGVAAAADLLEAPTGERAQDVSAWTSTVARSYARVYTDVTCTAVEPAVTADGTLALPQASAGRWIFVVTSSPQGQRQYGPAELGGIVLPADAVGVIACHGASTGTQLRAQAPAPTDAASPADPVPPAPVSAPPLPHAVESGRAGGAGGLAVLGLGTMAMAALAVRGRTARQHD